MKKALLSALVIALVSIGCKDDPDSTDEFTRTGTLEDRITGTWTLTDVDYQGVMPNPFNPNQNVSFNGEGEDTYGIFTFRADGTAEYSMEFTARIDIGTSEPARLPFYRPGTGTWWTNAAKDSLFVAESIDTIRYQILEDYDQKQRWQTVLPILDSISNTFVDVEMQVILRQQ